MASDLDNGGIRIGVETQYIEERSAPERSNYFFAYHITIKNVGDRPAKLISRHWVITDGTGRVEEVRGAGVVGHQPRLEPGDVFEYTSACPLRTPVGSMEGSYQMVRDDGEQFDAVIEPFTLAAPHALN